MPLSPLDDFLVHQIPETVDHVGTSDRNFYDRYYFNIHDQTGEVFAIIGLGQYPNLNTTDAFVALTYEGRQYTIRASRLLGSDRLDTRVGPIAVTVLEGLRRIGVTCDPNEWGIEFDLVFHAAGPAIEESPTRSRRHTRLVEDTRRFVQNGTWVGSLTVDGRTFQVTPDRWWGGRDHSWGVRGVGEREAGGAGQAKFGFGGAGDQMGGGLVNWSPMQFDDCGVFYVVYEGPDETRIREGAARVMSWERGGEEAELGSPRHSLDFVPGTRRVSGGSISIPDPDTGQDLKIEFRALARIYLDVGTGYGRFDAPHGSYLGDDFAEGRVFTHEECEERSDIDSALQRYVCDGAVGYGVMDTRVVNGHYPRYGFNQS